ncbi:MAG: hypothetical protein ACT4QE_23885, partial [Anaerolineales bacterium]
MDESNGLHFRLPSYVVRPSAMGALKLAWQFLRVGALNELQYRVNFFIQLLQSFIALGVGLVGLWLVFSHTTELG